MHLRSKKVFSTLLILTLVFFNFNQSIAQSSPTLSAGLETLVLNKGTIDVQALTEIITEKQKELKGEALKRFMFKMFPSQNYSTRFYVQNALNILLNEKNPIVIEKEILELTTNYALALGVTYALIKSNDDILCGYVINSKTMNCSETDKKMKISNDQSSSSKKRKQNLTPNAFHNAIEKIRGDRFLWLHLRKNLVRLETKIKSLERKASLDLKVNNTYVSEYDNTTSDLSKLERLKKRLTTLKYKRGIDNGDKIYNNVSGNLVELSSYFEINNLIDKEYHQIQKYIIKGKIYEAKELADKTPCNYEIENDNAELWNYFKYDSSFNTKPQAKTTSKILSFGELLDITSSALSEIKELREKGFYKTKVDYRDGEYYRGLEFQANGVSVKDRLNKLQVSIKNKIEKYVINFKIIEEFIRFNSGENNDSITKVFEDKFIEALTIKNRNSKNLYSIDEIREVLELNESIDALQSYRITFPNRVNDFVATKSKISKDSLLKEKLFTFNNINLDSVMKIAQKPQTSNNLESLIMFDTTETKTFVKEFYNSHLKDKTKVDFIQSILTSIIENPSSNTQESKNDSTDVKKLKNWFNPNEHLDSSVTIPSIVYDFLFKNYELEMNNYLSEKNDSSKSKLELDLTKVDSILLKKINSLKENRKAKYLELVKEPNIHKEVINGLLSKIENKFNDDKKQDKLIIPLNTNDTSKIKNEMSNPIADLYLRLKSTIKKDSVDMNDIIYIENVFRKKLVTAQYNDIDNRFKTINDGLAEELDILIPILKIEALKGLKLGKYNEQLFTLFQFISNLDQLNKAETFTSIVDMLREGSAIVREDLPEGEFKDGYLIFMNAIKKYSIVNSQENFVQVDVASFLTELEQYFNRNDESNFALYLSLGLNQNIFLKDEFTFPGSNEGIESIGFASEKLGLKFKLNNFKRFSGYNNVIKDDPYLNTKAPFINEWYAVIYGSGLLYSLANTSTNENFDFTHVGIGTGLRFYNSLDVNFTVGFPFVQDRDFGSDVFVGFGFDIPLGEYLEKIGGK